MKTKSEIINEINNRVMMLDKEDEETIFELISYHDSEPMAAAERISKFLECDYQAIFDLL